MQCITDKNFVLTAGGISIPRELNQNILQFFRGKDLLRFVMVSKKNRNDCRALSCVNV